MLCLLTNDWAVIQIQNSIGVTKPMQKRKIEYVFRKTSPWLIKNWVQNLQYKKDTPTSGLSVLFQRKKYSQPHNSAIS